MNITDIIKHLQIDVPALQAILGNYIDDDTLTEDNVKSAVRERLSSDPLYSQDAMRAVSDSVTFSTLATTLAEDEDFADALATVRDIDDEYLRQMRIDLFVEGSDALEREAPDRERTEAQRASRVTQALNFFVSES